ncbi:MAG: protein TonB [Lentisphaeria bacterium]
MVIAARLQQKPNFVMTGMPVPVYLTAAKYPRDALRKGLEGYVDVRFDITKMGATDNISVLAADPQGYFERSAIDAVTSWRYQPQMVDGDPARFEGMSKRIKFVMSQEK